MSTMSGHHKAVRKDKHHSGDARRFGAESRDIHGGGDREMYIQAMTDVQAALLTGKENKRLLQEVKRRSGADVQFQSRQSPGPDIKIAIIHGYRSQIEAAVKLINEKTGVQDLISEQAQKFWLQWVEAAFPDLDSRAYFLPPVYFNRVLMTRQLVSSQDVLVLEQPPEQASPPNSLTSTPAGVYPVQKTDIKYDAAFQRFLVCLQKMSEQANESLVGISQLEFGQYLGEPCYAAAAAHLPLPKNIPKDSSNYKQGDFDVLLIHRNYGLVVCEMKSVGDNLKKLNMSQQDIENSIRKTLKEAVSQLEKAEAMLSHLVSDIAPGLRITKTIAFPNLTAHQVQQAITGDTRLTQDLCRCLGTTDPIAIAGLCLCSDQLSDPKTPCDVSSHVLRELGHWWQRRVAGAGHDSHMTSHVYKTLVARFCGPATTVSVPCTSPPRVSVKTLGQAVWCTGECYTAVITLFPEQLRLLNTAPPTLFVTGPPGTGKTVVLLLMAIEWLRCGHHVYIVSTWWRSRAACTMLHYLLLQASKTQQKAGITLGQLHLLQYEFIDEKHAEKAVNDLSQAASGGSLYVIADEVVREYRSNFQTFCKNLLALVPGLHLWAASCYHGLAPANWHEEYLTRPLRSPPTVVREVQKSRDIAKEGTVHGYSDREVPDHTDGPPVRWLYHGGEGHLTGWLGDCNKCGHQVASFLHSLRESTLGQITNTSITSGCKIPPALQWRDILVLCWEPSSDNSGVVAGLREAGIPVEVMKDGDIKDVATARTDVVWVADGGRVQGLERKVVVCLGCSDLSVSLHNMSRCTSQLVIVCPDPNISSQD